MNRECVHVSSSYTYMVALSAADRWVEFRLGQANDYTIGICFFFAKHAALRRKSKDWVARNHENVSQMEPFQSTDSHEKPTHKYLHINRKL
jgi:hypothetical protein